MASEKLSQVEHIKEGSNYLRGNIAAELVDGNDGFGKDTTQLLKFHGTYQQDDRDNRTARAGAKSERQIIFMVRSKIPGGKLTSEQLLAELDLCEEVGNSTLRVTTRQGLQLHGVVKGNLKRAIARINEIKLSTLGACGDVNRNVMCCPAPHYHSPVHRQMQEAADTLAAYFAPRTGAYREIWLNDLETGEQTLVQGGPTEPVIEPIYGTNYLPRKFKMAIALPEDNCIDVYANDLGILAIVENDQIIGYNLVVGGSFGVTPANKKTFPAVAKRLAFCTPEQLIDVATAIVRVQKDYGNRSDRKQARLKYLLAEKGVPWFKQQVEEYYGHKLPDPHPQDVYGFDDHMGWNDQGDGRVYYGLNIENGRIRDEGDFRLKTAIRKVCRTFNPGIRLTGHQSILFTDLDPAVRPELESILREHGVPLTEDISNVRRWSMACPAWPTCGLAITESERALPSIINQLEVEVARLGLSSEEFTIRMTGCPNGCARPYNSDVGLVGKAAGRYTVLVGGRKLGDRLNFIYKDLVPAEEVVSTLVPLLAYFKHERQEGETFGDFCHRKGQEDLANWAEQYQSAEAA